MLFAFIFEIFLFKLYTYFGDFMQNERIEKLIGNNNIKKLNDLNVLLVGLGGVGGITFEMFVRSGINNYHNRL